VTEILSSKDATYAEVLKIIEAIEKEYGELDRITLQVREYLRNFTKCEKAEELVDKLMKETGLSRPTAVVVANILPANKTELRVILTLEKGKTFKEDDLDKILGIVSEVCPQ